MTSSSDPATTPLFEITDLQVAPVSDAPSGSASAAVHPDILKGLSLTIRSGETHALMGPHGSGKSTLASALMGSPEYTVTNGSVRFHGDDISSWGPDDRGRAGIFLAFQYPQAVSGVPVRSFLRQAMSVRKDTADLSILEVRSELMNWMGRLGMDPAFADRYLNEGFSGGEKKRNEILQLAMLEPEFAILDETDSGLDIDALEVVADGVNQIRAARPEMGTLIIAHHQRLLDHLVPDVVHILVDGRIVESGGRELVEQLERDGFAAWQGALA